MYFIQHCETMPFCFRNVGQVKPPPESSDLGEIRSKFRSKFRSEIRSVETTMAGPLVELFLTSSNFSPAAPSPSSPTSRVIPSKCCRIFASFPTNELCDEVGEGDEDGASLVSPTGIWK